MFLFFSWQVAFHHLLSTRCHCRQVIFFLTIETLPLQGSNNDNESNPMELAAPLCIPIYRPNHQIQRQTLLDTLYIFLFHVAIDYLRVWRTHHLHQCSNHHWTTDLFLFHVELLHVPVCVHTSTW